MNIAFSARLVLMVALGGFFGTLVRYGLTFITPGLDRSPGRATLIANALGSFLLGLWSGMGLVGADAALLAVGFTGALSTFSTLMYETWRLLQDGPAKGALLGLLANLLWGLTLLAGGFLLGTTLEHRP